MSIQLAAKPAEEIKPDPKAPEPKLPAAEKAQSKVDPIALEVIDALVGKAEAAIPPHLYSSRHVLDRTELSVGSDWTKLPPPIRALSASLLKHFDAIEGLNRDDAKDFGNGFPGITAADLEGLTLPAADAPDVSRTERITEAIAPDLIETFRKKLAEIGRQPNWLEDTVAKLKDLRETIKGTDFVEVSLFADESPLKDSTFAAFRLETDSKVYCGDFGKADAEALRAWINPGMGGAAMEVTVADGKITKVQVFADSFGLPGSPAKAVAESYRGKEVSRSVLTRLGSDMRQAILKAIEPYKPK
jgi:hypothetical protein